MSVQTCAYMCSLSLAAAAKVAQAAQKPVKERPRGRGMQGFGDLVAWPDRRPMQISMMLCSGNIEIVDWRVAGAGNPNETTTTAGIRHRKGRIVLST